MEAVGQNRCGLTGDLFRLRFLRKVRIIHKVVSDLGAEPAMKIKVYKGGKVSEAEFETWLARPGYSP